MKARPDVTRFDVTIVDTKNENEHDLGHEQQPEKKGEAAQRLLTALFKRHVVDLINKCPEHIKDGEHHDAHHDRIDAERDVDDVRDVRTEDDESRVCDI